MHVTHEVSVQPMIEVFSLYPSREQPCLTGSDLCDLSAVLALLNRPCAAVWLNWLPT